MAYSLLSIHMKYIFVLSLYPSNSCRSNDVAGRFLSLSLFVLLVYVCVCKCVLSLSCSRLLLLLLLLLLLHEVMMDASIERGDEHERE